MFAHDAPETVEEFLIKVLLQKEQAYKDLKKNEEVKQMKPPQMVRKPTKLRKE